MQVYIYIHSARRRIWAVNELGTTVVFGGEGSSMQYRQVNYKDWAAEASKKMASGYEFICGFAIGSNGGFITSKELLETVSILRNSWRPYLSFGSCFIVDMIVPGCFSTMNRWCAIFASSFPMNPPSGRMEVRRAS